VVPQCIIRIPVRPQRPSSSLILAMLGEECSSQLRSSPSQCPLTSSPFTFLLSHSLLSTLFSNTQKKKIYRNVSIISGTGISICTAVAVAASTSKHWESVHNIPAAGWTCPLFLVARFRDGSVNGTESNSLPISEKVRRRPWLRLCKPSESYKQSSNSPRLGNARHENAHNFLCHQEFVLAGQTANFAFCCDVLCQLREDVRRLRPELWRRKNWLLHHENSPSHTSSVTRELLTENKETIVPAQPTVLCFLD
jgi:hypothetical protein